jgi:hypothetical protein
VKQDCGFVCLDLREREIKRVKKKSDLCGFGKAMYEERERDQKGKKKREIKIDFCVLFNIKLIW